MILSVFSSFVFTDIVIPLELNPVVEYLVDGKFDDAVEILGSAQPHDWVELTSQICMDQRMYLKVQAIAGFLSNDQKTLGNAVSVVRNFYNGYEDDARLRAQSLSPFQWMRASSLAMRYANELDPEFWQKFLQFSHQFGNPIELEM